MIKKPATFTIKRSEWARRKQDRSQPAGRSYLLNDQGGKCCLGFFALACGIKAGDITRRSRLNEVYLNLHLHVKSPIGDESLLVAVNDRSPVISPYKQPDWTNVTDAEQEQLIAAGFALIGVKVKFED